MDFMQVSSSQHIRLLYVAGFINVYRLVHNFVLAAVKYRKFCWLIEVIVKCCKCCYVDTLSIDVMKIIIIM